MANENNSSSDDNLPRTQSGAAEVVYESSPEQILKNFSTLLQNPQDRKAFVSAVSGKASKWTTRHKGPYYKPKYALQFKEVVDKIIQDGRPRVYRYKDYPEFKPQSLYIKLLQSRAYLVDHLDAEGKYKYVCSAILMHKKYGVGIIMHLQQDLLNDSDSDERFKNPSVLANDTESWREKLHSYLQEEKPQGRFEANGLILSDEEQADLEVQLSQLTNIAYHITQEKVVVVKEI